MPPESEDCFVFCELDLVVASLFEVFLIFSVVAMERGEEGASSHHP